MKKWLIITVLVLTPIYILMAPGYAYAVTIPGQIAAVPADLNSKVIGAGLLTRCGLRSNTMSALNKAATVWGSRAVEGVSLGEVAAGATVVAGGAAAIGAGVTAPAWVPVVLTGAAVVSAVAATVDLYNAFTSGDAITSAKENINYGPYCKLSNTYQGSTVCYCPVPCPTAVGEVSTSYSPDGHSLSFECNSVGSLSGEPIYYADIYIDGVYQSNWHNNSYRPGNVIGFWSDGSASCCYPTSETHHDTHTFMAHVWTVPTGWDGQTVSATHDVSVAQADYNTSSATTPQTPASQGITINVPDVNKIKQDNPTWNDEQIMAKVEEMIKANPQYVTNYYETTEGVSPPATLTGISISTMPSKTVYHVGDPLDVSGMEISETWSDNSTQTVNVTNDMVMGFDSSEAVQSQTLTVTDAGVSTTFDISIEAVPDDNGINWEPLKMAGDAFTNKFPFSLPWDLMRSFEAVKVTSNEPSWHVDCSDVLSGFTFDIDLTQWDFLITPVRAIELFFFDLGLVLITRKLLGGAV